MRGDGKVPVSAYVVAKTDNKDAMPFLWHAKVSCIVDVELYVIAAFIGLIPRSAANRFASGAMLLETRLVLLPTLTRYWQDEWKR